MAEPAPAPDPLDLAESPWVDPVDDLRLGTYRRAAVDASDGIDHLVAYIRGPDGTELYRAALAACGKAVVSARGDRFGDACAHCFDGIALAFRRGRETIGQER